MSHAAYSLASRTIPYDGKKNRPGGERRIGPAPLARVTGLEPATSGVTGRRSNQLSYTRNREALQLGRRAGRVKPWLRSGQYGR
jgi:hypothetical protein